MNVRHIVVSLLLGIHPLHPPFRKMLLTDLGMLNRVVSQFSPDNGKGLRTSGQVSRLTVLEQEFLGPSLGYSIGIDLDHGDVRLYLYA